MLLLLARGVLRRQAVRLLLLLQWDAAWCLTRHARRGASQLLLLLLWCVGRSRLQAARCCAQPCTVCCLPVCRPHHLLLLLLLLLLHR
jgi:hypothetical protein